MATEKGNGPNATNIRPAKTHTKYAPNFIATAARQASRDPWISIADALANAFRGPGQEALAEAVARKLHRQAEGADHAV